MKSIDFSMTEVMTSLLDPGADIHAEDWVLVFMFWCPSDTIKCLL